MTPRDGLKLRADPTRGLWPVTQPMSGTLVRTVRAAAKSRIRHLMGAGWYVKGKRSSFRDVSLC